MAWFFIARIVLALLLSAVSYVLAPRQRQETPVAAGLDAFDIPTAEEGRPIPVVFGTILVTGPNVVWAGDLKVEPLVKSGGKT
jgi:hypothetical protein